MSKKLRNILSIVFALALAVSVTVSVNAASDELTVNSDVKAKVGDKVKYTIYMSDGNLDVLGITMNVFYDSETLKLDPDSISYEKFDGVVQNPNLDGYFRFTWTNINDVQDFSKKAMLVSAEFEVIDGGEADLSYFITDLYGDVEKMETLSSYTLTSDISVNDKVVASGVTPIVNQDKSAEDKLQGDFINYLDGMGEANTPNKDDHESFVAERKYISQEIQTQVVDVTNPVEQGSLSFSPVLLIVIIAIIIIALAAVAIIIVRRKDNAKMS